MVMCGITHWSILKRIMRLRFYAALTLSVLAIGLGLFDLLISPDANTVRASLGILVGLGAIVIAFVRTQKKTT